MRPVVAFNGAQAGYYTDNDTGRVLCALRYYNPATSQFINRDPIGYGGGANVYAFCGNNPVNAVDPSGTQAIAAAPLVLAGGAAVLIYIYVVGLRNSGYQPPAIYLPNGTGTLGYLPGPKTRPAHSAITSPITPVAMRHAPALVPPTVQTGTCNSAEGSAAHKLGDQSGKSLGEVLTGLNSGGFAEHPPIAGSTSPYRRFDHPDGSRVYIDTANRVVKVQGPKLTASDGSKYPDRIEPHNQHYNHD